jgi:S1-C subfamily serine protease
MAALVVALAMATVVAVPASADRGDITGSLPESGGVAAVMWGGGQVDDLVVAAAAGGCGVQSVWVFDAGAAIGYVVGAPQFVNFQFLGLFPGGELTEGSILILTCDAIERAAAPPPADDPPPAVGCDIASSARAVADSTALVETPWGTGSAFYIGGGEWITAAHVVFGSETVTLYVGGAQLTAEVLGSHISSDIAVLRAETSVAALEWGVAPELASPVAVIGYPLGADTPSVTQGNVSRLFEVEGVSVVQTDAAINPGNSGGPVVDECGQVVGVVSARLSESEGIGFAVAATEAQEAIPLALGNPPGPGEYAAAALDFMAMQLFSVWDAGMERLDMAFAGEISFEQAAADLEVARDDMRAIELELRDMRAEIDPYGESCAIARFALEDAAKQGALIFTNFVTVVHSGVADASFGDTVVRQAVEMDFALVAAAVFVEDCRSEAVGTE